MGRVNGASVQGGKYSYMPKNGQRIGQIKKLKIESNGEKLKKGEKGKIIARKKNLTKKIETN